MKSTCACGRVFGKAALATALLATAASGALATPLNFASYAIYTPAGSTLDSASNASGAVGVASGPGTGSAAASADFNALKATAQASAAANSLGWGTTYADASTSFQILVGAVTAPPAGGGSGVVFSNLDPVTLSMSFRIDGALQAGSNSSAGTPSASSLGSAGATANLKIVDKNIKLGCGSSEGCFTPRLLEFGMNAYAESSDRGIGFSPDNYHTWSWSLDTVDEFGVPTGHQFNSSDSSVFSAFLFDTGMLTATVSTHIGAVLDVSGYLSLLAQGYIGGTSSLDFLNTMGFAFTAPEGVQLTYLSGGTSVVPLAGTLPMLLAGLFGFGFYVRRKGKV